MSEGNYEIQKPSSREIITEPIQNTKTYYEKIKNNPTIEKIFSDEELESLLGDINQETINKYGTEALLGLLADFDKKDIDTDLIKQEILVLQKANISIELLGLKKEILTKNTSVIDTNTSVIDTKAEYIYKKIVNLKDIYANNIDQIFKPNTTSIERQQFYQEKRNVGNIESILQKNNIDPNFYFQIRYTAEQLIKNSNELSEDHIQFISQFNTLNKSLNIDYQITIPTEKMQFADKPKNLSDVIASSTTVLAYPSVREYTSKQANIIDKSDEKIDINPKLQQDIWTKLSPKKQEEIQEAIKKNCIDNKLLTSTDFNYTTTIDIKLLLRSPDTIDDATKRDIQKIIDSILGSYAQDYLISQTNTQAKQLIITQAIAGLASYFDTTTGPTENYASNFDLTKEGNISIENNVLHISGQMHGQIVHFFYNLQTGELQANDYLYKVIKAESFLINDIDQGRYTLPNALPTITDLEKTMKDIDYVNMIQNSTSLNNYQTTIRKQSDAIKEKFSNQTYNKLYITRTNEKNLFIQETLDGIGGQPRLLKIAGRPISIDNTPNPIEISRSLHPNEYELLLLLDRTSQAYRSPEQLRDMRNCINRRKQAIQDPRIANGIHNDPVINKLFSQQALLKNTENRNNPSKKSNFLLFFDLVSNPQNHFGGGILDINLLEKVIHRIESNQPIAVLEDPKSLDYANDPRYFNEKYEKIIHENL